MSANVSGRNEVDRRASLGAALCAAVSDAVLRTSVARLIVFQSTAKGCASATTVGLLCHRCPTTSSRALVIPSCWVFAINVVWRGDVVIRMWMKTIMLMRLLQIVAAVVDGAVGQ